MWLDSDRKCMNHIILFTDGKDDRYICDLGDDDLLIKKITN